MIYAQVRNFRVTRREPGLAKARVISHALIGLVMGVMYYDIGGSKGARRHPQQSAFISRCLTPPGSVDERIALLLFSMTFLMLTSALPTILAILPELSVLAKARHNNNNKKRKNGAQRQEPRRQRRRRRPRRGRQQRSHAAHTLQEHHNNWYALRAYYVAKLISDAPLLTLPTIIYLSLMVSPNRALQ